MTTRRETLITVGAILAAPLAALPQDHQSTAARIGLLEADSISARRREALIAGLREQGLAEGKNVIIEYRAANGKYERLPVLAAELVQMKLEVIVAASSPAIRAAKAASAGIPIVMVRPGDPVAAGFVASLARPGGNITGLSNINVDLSSKRLELLRDAVPKLSRVGVLLNPGNVTHPAVFKTVQVAAKTSGVKLIPISVGSGSDIEPAFAAMKRERAEALIVFGDPFFGSVGRRIAELAVLQRLPTIFSTQERVEAGGLMSYGPSDTEDYYRAATYIAKILKGAKPRDLPVEQPTKIELAISLKTAKAIGLTIPQALLLRAQKVIE